MGRSSKIFQLASKAELMNVSIKFGKQEFQFNLYEELRIVESDMQDDIIQHPASYGFLKMLHTKLSLKVKDLEISKRSKEEELRVYYLGDKKSEYYKENSKFPSQGLADSLVKSNDNYLEILNKLNKAEKDRNLIEACVLAFEQKKDLIQTLSANIRKERT